MLALFWGNMDLVKLRGQGGGGELAVARLAAYYRRSHVQHVGSHRHRELLMVQYTPLSHLFISWLAGCRLPMTHQNCLRFYKVLALTHILYYM